MKHHSDHSNLTDLKVGQSGMIIAVGGGRMPAKRLADMGLTPGTAIKVLRKTLFSGPVQIEVCGSRLVLGRGLATRIIVEPR